MDSRNRTIAALTTLIFLASTPLAAEGGGGATEAPMVLKLKGPPRLGDDGLMLSGDWALVLELSASDAIGMVDEDLPRENANRALVISDPDDCVDMRDWVEAGVPGSPYEAGCTGQNELYTKFNPDSIDMPGLLDLGGSAFGSMIDNNLRTALQDDPFDAGNMANLNVQYYFNGVDTSPRKAGAKTEGFDSSFNLVTSDGYGYGVNDDLPGLFVWAEIGSGIVSDTSLNPVTNSAGGKRLRNMAGLFNSVHYNQFTKDDETSIVAVMTVDRGMLEPIIQLDFNIDPDSGEAVGGYLRRFDGGPVEEFFFSDQTGSLFQDDAFREVFADLEPYEVVIRAVMVEGQAAAFVEDLDGNGKINKKDIELAGYTLLSDGARYALRAIQIEALESGAFECPEESVFKEVNFDGSPLFGVGCATGSARSLVRRPQ